jgi:hypothetical protein
MRADTRTSFCDHAWDIARRAFTEIGAVTSQIG